MGADFGEHGEGLGDVVAEGVAGVGAGGVGFVDFGGGAAGAVGGPGDGFEVADEFGAAGVDEESHVAEHVSEPGVDAINTVADGWIDLIDVN